MNKETEAGNSLLIIDDDANFREIFSAKLTAAGYKVETASSGEEGVAKAKKLKPHLILMDMQMPGGISGADALVKLKKQEETKEVKVVFLTNFGDAGMEATEKLVAAQLGALDYFKKSEDLDVLVQKIKTYLT